MWRYFVELLQGRCAGDYVEGKDYGDGLPVCGDFNYAMNFETPEVLLQWVKENTKLNYEDEDFAIKGIFFPNYNETGCW